MGKTDFSGEEKEIIVGKIQNYFSKELDQEIGRFDAEFLLDFFLDEVGPYYYNSALKDARVVLESKMENITDALYELEKPTK